MMSADHFDLIRPERRAEVRRLLSLTPAEVRQRAAERLIVCSDLEALHRRMAEDIAAEIGAAQGHSLRLILPVGPTGAYPYLVKLIAARQLSLAHCWFFFMDEYCDSEGRVLPPEHPLSFRGTIERLFLAPLRAQGCQIAPEGIIFPDQENYQRLPQLIEALGGIQTCYGGIGIHGHLAFNEPEIGVAERSVRRVQLNAFTITMNAIRANIGGNIACFPREAYTLGMREILSAQRIRLYCRNDVGLDWANTVLRLALFGEAGDDFPVTHIRGHDYTIITDEATLASPKYLI
jgi:glucosamine-6-phosphate deaminase